MKDSKTQPPQPSTAVLPKPPEPICEICGQPGEPSWGDSILCETCYGTLGATCAGRPRPAVGPVC